MGQTLYRSSVCSPAWELGWRLQGHRALHAPQLYCTLCILTTSALQARGPHNQRFFQHPAPRRSKMTLTCNSSLNEKTLQPRNFAVLDLCNEVCYCFIQIQGRTSSAAVFASPWQQGQHCGRLPRPRGSIPRRSSLFRLGDRIRINPLRP